MRLGELKLTERAVTAGLRCHYGNLLREDPTS